MECTENKFLIDVVGGPSDGQTWRFDLRPKVEDTVLRASEKSSDRYVFESDEKFHYHGIAPPPVPDLPQEQFDKLQQEVDQIIGQMSALAKKLSETYRAVGGCQQHFDLTFWELRPNYRLMQQIVDTEAPLMREGYERPAPFW